MASWLLPVALVLPPLLLGIEGALAGYLSNAHAQFLAEALMIDSRGDAGLVSWFFPPLPLVLVLIYPKAFMAVVWGAIAMAWLAWFLIKDGWRHNRLVLLASIPLLLFTPLAFNLITANYHEAVSLFFLYLAWRWYGQWLTTGIIAFSFQAGLMMALAAFASPLALPLALMLGLSPSLERVGSFGAYITGWLILTFPALLSVGAWSFAAWVFSGSFAQFTLGITGESVALWEVMILSPIFLVGLVVCLIERMWARVFALVLLFVFVAFAALAGIATLSMNVLLLSLLGIAILPDDLSGTSRFILILALIVQAALAWMRVPLPDYTIIPESMQEEHEVAATLAQLGDARVLTDEKTTYRIVAKTGSAYPYVLPTDKEAYFEAYAAPYASVDYVLLHDAPSELNDRYRERVPVGFFVEKRWDDYTLYRRRSALPLDLIDADSVRRVQPVFPSVRVRPSPTAMLVPVLPQVYQP
ncbi:MAG: hypothetical protein RhofKO_31670 [Rhodothermales bacterium]